MVQQRIHVIEYKIAGIYALYIYRSRVFSLIELVILSILSLISLKLYDTQASSLPGHETLYTIKRAIRNKYWMQHDREEKLAHTLCLEYGVYSRMIKRHKSCAINVFQSSRFP
jgi:hypothetical protein